MSTKAPFFKRYRKGIAIPAGLKPFPFISGLENKKVAPPSDGDKDLTATPTNGIELYAVFDLGTTLGHELPIKNDAHRRALLQRVIEKIKSGYDMANRDVKIVLTRDEWKAFRVEMIRLNPPMPNDIASVLKKYDDLVRHADRLHNLAAGRPKANRAGKRFRDSRRKKSLSAQANTKYEDALEFLEEIAERYPGIEHWFDRHLKFSNDDFHTAEPEGVPRLITSRSQYSHQGQKKRDLKLRTLQASLANLDMPPSERPPAKRALVPPPMDDMEDLGLTDSDSSANNSCLLDTDFDE